MLRHDRRTAGQQATEAAGETGQRECDMLRYGMDSFMTGQEAAADGGKMGCIRIAMIKCGSSGAGGAINRPRNIGSGGKVRSAGTPLHRHRPKGHGGRGTGDEGRRKPGRRSDACVAGEGTQVPSGAQGKRSRVPW